jgi:predicted ATPase/DNA-binding SARP family transcriptional activator
MDFRVLGPIEVRDGDRVLSLGHGKERALLALLLLQADQTVSVDRIIDELWGERPPATARKSVHVCVSKLRKLLGSRAILTRPPGYELTLEGHDLDLRRFDRLIAEARAALEAGDPGASSRLLGDAVGLWRGPPLADVAFEPFAQPEVARLEALRLEALETRIDVDLELGRHAEVAAELEQLVLQHPLRERLRRQLMLALYRCGRQADALGAYQAARQALIAELGIEPGPALRELERAILQQDAALAAPERAAAPSPASTPARGNLPAHGTSFVGRERELRELGALVVAERLVTIHGPGGSGKTRLAIRTAEATAAHFESGTWLIELAPVADPKQVWQAVAATLGVREEPGRSVAESVVEALRRQPVLLVLDNCEHLLDAVRDVTRELLAGCPPVHMLATSRERLADSAEVLWPIPALSAPAASEPLEVEALLAHDAIRLFAERGARSLHGFRLDDANGPAVAQICLRLDGMPLAIELAAARLDVLAPEQIAERLDDRFRLLTRGELAAPERHRTLRATVDWSYALLTETEQTALTRASVFAGSFDLDAAERVLPSDGIEREDVLDLVTGLVGKSLVARNEVDGRARYALHETIREYAAGRLAEREDPDHVSERHLEWCVALLTEADEQLRGADQASWALRLAPDQDNFRQALAWGLAHGRAPRALEVAWHLDLLWSMRGVVEESERWLDATLAATAGAPASVERSRALTRWGDHAFDRGDFATAGARYGQALEMARALGHTVREGVGVLSLGDVDLAQGRLDDARRRLEAADELLRDAGDPERARWPGERLGHVALAAGDTAEARRRFEASRAAARALGNENGMSEATLALGQAAQQDGDYDAARGLFEEAHGLARRAMDVELESRCALAIGLLAVDAGAENEAAATLAAALPLLHHGARRPLVAGCLEGLGAVALARGEAERAVRLLGAAAAFREQVGSAPFAPDRDRADRTLAAARAELDGRAFAIAFGAGRALGWSDAVDYALASQ